MEEVFVQVKEYEGLYEVSNLGNIRSLPKADGRAGRILKQELLSSHSHTNYRRVTLSKNGKTERFAVHRLVAKSFIDNPECKPHVNHIDNNGENNTVWNLEWCTQTENMEHSSKQGRQDSARKAGGIALGMITTDRVVTRAKDILQERLISYTHSEGRLYFVYTCLTCSKETTARSDSHSYNKGGYCRSCSRKINIL